MQYLNIMTELEINKLATMLSSEDTEIRKIALSILINKYDLDFNIWEDFDPITWSWVYSFQKRGFQPKKYNVLVFLKMLVIRRIIRVESYNYKEIIKLIIEYNERKQNK